MKLGILCSELFLTCSQTQAELSRLSEIENSLAIFCMATYGEGDPTDNAQDFYDWLQENGEEDLSGVNFTVSYTCHCEHYCTNHLNHNHHKMPKSQSSQIGSQLVMEVKINPHITTTISETCLVALYHIY